MTQQNDIGLLLAFLVSVFVVIAVLRTWHWVATMAREVKVMRTLLEEIAERTRPDYTPR